MSRPRPGRARARRLAAHCARSAAAAAPLLATLAHADWIAQDLQADPAAPRSATGTAIAMFQPSATAGTSGTAAVTMWAGAPLATGGRRDAGLVHAWRFQANPGVQWGYAGQLASGNPQSGAAFGAAVAWGQTTSTDVGFLVVGSPRARRNPNSAEYAEQCFGYAEAFPITNVTAGPVVAGTPVPLLHPSPAQNDLYGAAVATALVDGVPYALVSAPYDDLTVNGTLLRDAGTVQCFRRDAASSFPHVATLSAPTPGANARFGDAICAAGGRIYVSEGFNVPRVAVFRFEGGVPVFESHIGYVGESTAYQEGFATAIACDGTFLAVGGPGPERSPPGVGRVWLFDAAPPHALRATIESPFADECAGFGSAVALERGTLVVGTAEGADALLAGMAAVYSVDATTAAVTPLFTEADAGESGFGCVVATSGLHVAVGAPSRGAGVEGGVRAVTSRPARRTPDLNGDGIVSGADLGLLVGMFRIAASNSPGDLNYDGQVNGLDLGLLLAAWGTAG